MSDASVKSGDARSRNVFANLAPCPMKTLTLFRIHMWSDPIKEQFPFLPWEYDAQRKRSEWMLTITKLKTI